jgi:predicted nucleic acid-binding protein
MANMDPQASMILAGVVLTALVALAAWLMYRNTQSHRLEHRFGPEYRRAVEDLGSRTKAESELREREKRVSRFNIVPLSREDAVRFGQAWKALQAKFVDDPKGAVQEADTLVRELMQERGYPMGDFDRLAADLSVDHAVVVDNYRAATAIVMRDQRGEADTEALRNAVVHYRTLFHELLEVDDKRANDMPAQPQETR